MASNETEKIKVRVLNGEISQSEADWYREEYSRKHEGERLEEIIVEIDEKDPEYANVKCVFADRPFERIRRITGYLVGTLDRFNDAKRAEESQRVKHAAE